MRTRETDTHVLPIDDLVEHEQIRQCWCRPQVVDDLLVVHNSADGREYFEPDGGPQETVQ